MFILVDPSILVSGKKINFFLLLRIHSFLPYNSPGAGAGAGARAGAVLFLKGRSRSRSRRKSGGSETLQTCAKYLWIPALSGVSARLQYTGLLQDTG